MAKPQAPLEYPFTPKSNRRLARGHFWSIDLLAGGWACGVVLGIDETPRSGGTVQFIGGLLDWKGDDRPRAEDIKDISDYAGPMGIHHVLQITELGGTIDGWCDISRPNTSPMIAHMRVFDGVSFLRRATSEDRKRYDVMLGFNLGTLWVRANHVLGGFPDDELQKIYRQRVGRG